jgi:hypothetical protein
MTLLADLAHWNLAAFALLLFAMQFIAQEFGHWIGRRQLARVEGTVEGVGIIVGGMLGLLAFVLALTLSFANGRFAERRAGSLEEANAIGTAWLRAEAIQDPRGKEIAQLLEEYTKLESREFVEGFVSSCELEALHFVSVLLIGKKFREDVVFGGIEEEFM